MGKVFQVESKNSGVFMGLVGGVLISLLLFLVLPFNKKILSVDSLFMPGFG